MVVSRLMGFIPRPITLKKLILIYLKTFCKSQSFHPPRGNKNADDGGIVWYT